MAGDSSSTKTTTGVQQLLADALPEEERQQLEEQLMIDDDLFDSVLADEHDLLDAAARGELTPVEQKVLSALPDAGEQLAFARALARVADESKAVVVRPRWRHRVAWLAAAASLVMAVGLWHGRGTGPTGIEPIVLPASGLRGDVAELTIGPQQDRVELLLELSESRPADSNQRLQVQLQGQGMAETLYDLQPRHYEWGDAVRLGLAADRLAPGLYSAQLRAVSSDGALVELGQYTFRVIRPPSPESGTE